MFKQHPSDRLHVGTLRATDREAVPVVGVKTELGEKLWRQRLVVVTKRYRHEPRARTGFQCRLWPCGSRVRLDVNHRKAPRLLFPALVGSALLGRGFSNVVDKAHGCARGSGNGEETQLSGARTGIGDLEKFLEFTPVFNTIWPLCSNLRDDPRIAPTQRPLQEQLMAFCRAVRCALRGASPQRAAATDFPERRPKTRTLIYEKLGPDFLSPCRGMASL